VKKVLGVATLVGVAALVYAAVALATGTQQSYSDVFGTKKPGKATTTTFKLSSTDPTNTAGNHAPDPARKVVIAFPKGANIDYKAAATCNASGTDFQNKGTGACPSGSLIGSGAASANTTFASVGEIQTTVTAFNGKNKLLLYVQPQGGAAQPFLITANVTGSKKSGFKLTTTPPPNCLPPGQPPSCSSGEAPLDSFSLTTKNKSKGSGKNKHTFLTTPTTCPKSKKWTFTATITFKTDGTKTYTSTTPCTK
jgi:hypothetical protein